MSLKSSRFAVVPMLFGCALPVMAPAQSPADEDAKVDEVIVTGSFIRRSEGFTPASPVAEIDKADFEANAPKTVADFLTQLPYSFNTSFTVGRNLGSSNGSGGLNLRNLGQDASLVLLNSRRTARDANTVSSVDVNALVPQIAIERIEILKDGASSIYGSDAIGGVANFLTRRNFDGLEVQAQGDMRQIGRTTDYRAAGIWGAQSDKGGVVVSAEFFRRDPYNIESLELIDKNRDSIIGQFRLAGWPARYTIPNRTATGTLATGATGTTTIADPLCALFTTANNVTGAPVTRLGVSYPSNCQQDVPYGTNANADETRAQAFVEVHHEFNPALKFFGEAGFLRSRDDIADTPGAAVNPGPGQPGVIIPGYAPSNTFRALNSAGQPLFAQSSGTQLGYDKNGDGVNEFIPLRNSSGVVQLNLGADGIAGTADDAVGGVPFWEDVTITAGSRIFGLNCNLPGNPATTVNCRNSINTTKYRVDTQRYVGGLEGDLFGGDNWHYIGSYVLAQNTEYDSTLGSTFSMPNLRAALAGYGGSGCLTASNDPLLAGTVRPGSGACQFFNVFGTSVTTTPGSLIANTPDMITYITAQDYQRSQTISQAADFVVSGSLFSVPAGKVGIAIGAQHRSDQWSVDYPALQNAGQSDLQAAFYDKNTKQQSNAVFAEIDVPILARDTFGTLDLNAAVRHETVAGLDTTDPKFGLLYATPGGLLKLRGTWSTSFLAPTLYQRFRQNVQFTNGVDDVLTPAVDNLARVPTVITGNPSLEPQTSTNYNLGFTLKPLPNLTFDADYWHFTFEGKIDLQSALELAFSPATTLNTALVQRSTSAGTVLVNGVNVGQIVGFNISYFNNQSVETAGFDLGLTHTQDIGALGVFRTSLLATYQNKYTINGRDVTRSRNSRVAGGSFAIPWRATLRNVWSLGNSSVQSLVRYTDSYYNDTVPNAGTFTKLNVEPYMSWDLSYSYDFNSMFGAKKSQVALGVNNLLDKQPPYVPDGNHTLSSIYDYSGRHFWLRLRASF